MKNTPNKLFSYLFCVTVVSSLITGCKKEDLNPVPQTTLSDITSFSSPVRIQQQVFGVYAGIKNGQFLGGRALAYQDIRGEDWVNVTNNGITGVGVWNFSLLSNDKQVEDMWAAGYAAINRANVVLDGVDANASILSAQQANSFKGEVCFCRALSYFYLQSLYARNAYNVDNGTSPSVPLRIVANKSPENASLGRSTQAEVFQQILNDLDFAEANLPVSYGATGDSNVVRAHKNAAIAMKMRVYQHMNRWDDVIREGNKIVSTDAPFHSPSNINHSLGASVLSVFRSPYTSTENIFSLPMANTNSAGNQNGLSQFWTNDFGLNPDGILADVQWSSTDARKTSFVIPASGSTPARWTKFNDDLTNYVTVIRYAEVLLNLAEAIARQSTSVDTRALSLLNEVRHRSDASTTFAPSNQTELINFILNERRIELLGEGFRSLDIMRQRLAFPAKGSAPAVPISSVTYVWPIPASEVLLNSLIKQNE